MSFTSDGNSTVNILEELRSALQKYGEIERPQEITESTLVNTLELDSITLSYVFAGVERSYGITFENDKVDPTAYSRVADLVDAIDAQIRRAAG